MDIEKTIIAILPALQNYILELKQSYFSAEGKPEANWAPLKEKTIIWKTKYAKSIYANDFNRLTGNLRDSCKIDIDYNTKTQEINIKCTFDGLPDKAIERLTVEYGRDFLSFDEIDRQKISTKFKDLFLANLIY